MVAGLEWLSPTRLAGLTTYAISVLACAARLRKSRLSGVSGRVFALLTGVQLGLLLDMAFDWRWKLHEYWIWEATSHGVYEQRQMPQLVALIVLGVAVTLTSILIFYRFRGRVGLAIAMTGTMLSTGLWCSEWVSYHMVDHLFYHAVGKLMFVSLLWVGLTVFTCAGVWLDGRRHTSLELEE